MRHPVRRKSLSCPHFHVLSFLRFGMARTDRKRGEIALARYHFEMTRSTLFLFDSLACQPLVQPLQIFPSKKLNETTGFIEEEDNLATWTRGDISLEISRKKLERNLEDFKGKATFDCAKLYFNIFGFIERWQVLQGLELDKLW